MTCPKSRRHANRLGEHCSNSANYGSCHTSKYHPAKENSYSAYEIQVRDVFDYHIESVIFFFHSFNSTTKKRTKKRLPSGTRSFANYIIHLPTLREQVDSTAAHSIAQSLCILGISCGHALEFGSNIIVHTICFLALFY